jgi:histidinol-phosphate aminotransferase
MSVGSVRSDLDEVPPYVPGRSAAGAIKLSSNEVPGAPLPSVLAAINVAAQAGNRYPDMSCVELTHALAQRLGVDEQDVVVGCGSVSLCTQVVQATCSDGDEVVFAWRSFEAYPILVRVVGAVPVQVPLTTQFGHDLEAMLAVITPRTRVVFLCSPNNPTGTVLRRSELIRFLDAVPAHVVVVLDEAYTEFVRDPEVPDGVGLATGRENLVVLRTFSKAYGLAGLRVGYGYAPTEIAAAIRKVSVPFSVSALAQAAALASLEAADELLQRCDEIALERVRVHKALLTSGFTVPESQANFVWLPLGDDTTAFTEKCTAAGVLVRGFTGAGVRVTIGLPAENDAFLAVALN